MAETARYPGMAEGNRPKKRPIIGTDYRQSLRRISTVRALVLASFSRKVRLSIVARAASSSPSFFAARSQRRMSLAMMDLAKGASAVRLSRRQSLAELETRTKESRPSSPSEGGQHGKVQTPQSQACPSPRGSLDHSPAVLEVANESDEEEEDDLKPLIATSHSDMINSNDPIKGPAVRSEQRSPLQKLGQLQHHLSLHTLHHRHRPKGEESIVHGVSSTTSQSQSSDVAESQDWENFAGSARIIFEADLMKAYSTSRDSLPKPKRRRSLSEGQRAKAGTGPQSEDPFPPRRSFESPGNAMRRWQNLERNLALFGI